MEDSKKQFIEAVKQATNILVTVRSSPSIDQLAACIALTLMLNEMGKHATAVFSGKVPSVLEFLEPEKTIHQNADSLQDFIISLDKAKADKLRYKVEDTVVRIYITPYKTSLTASDLEFGQGDYNVDVVVALGVHAQSDLDEAVTAHGRILHDATVVSINTTPGVDKDLGSVNWLNENVSSLSEMLAASADDLAGDKKDILDNQVATALLTGIVAETDRFGNSKTTPETMQVSAKLLTAGANQELVSTKLAAPVATAVVTDTSGSENGQSDISLPDMLDKKSADSADESKQGTEEMLMTSPDNGLFEIDHDGAVASSVETVEAPAAMEIPVAPETSGAPDTPNTPDNAEKTEALDEDEASQLPEISVVRAEAGDSGQAGQFGQPDISPASAAPLADTELNIVSDTTEPKTYDLNQISVPASIPITPTEQELLPSLADSVPAAQAADVSPSALAAAPATVSEADHSNIMPLRDQNNFLAQPPLHDKTLDPQAGTTGGSVDETLDPTKFAVTPPSMGGTLTAGLDQSDVDTTNDPMAGSLIRSRAIMKHDSQVFPGAEHGQLSESDLENADDAQISEPLQGLDPEAEPAEKTGLPQFGLIHSGDAGDAQAVAPSAKQSHVIVPATDYEVSDDGKTADFSDLTASLLAPTSPVEAVDTSAASSSHENATLAQIETEVHSPHLAQMAAPDMTTPELKPLDMPFPSAVSPEPALQPVLEAAALDHSADMPHSPPPPVAPPFMPLSGSVG